MKKIILLLFAAVSLHSFAGEPQKTAKANSKTQQQSYVLTPQPVDPTSKQLDCCKFTNLGYSWMDGCYTILYNCWEPCGNHSWCITSCQAGVVIRGAKMVADDNGPVKANLPLTTGLIDSESYDVDRDPILQMTQINQIKNANITIPNDFTVESVDYTLIIKKGNYQILNSELLVIAE